MDVVLRLLLRFLLVPLGYLAAVAAGTAVILIGSWRLGELATSVNPDEQTLGFFSLVLAGPVLFMILLTVMWLPAAAGVLLAEAFALRSWIYHAANGAAAAWLGWQLFGPFDETGVPINDTLSVVAAGLAGGLAYWLVAGWNAGFWKPVFGQRQRALSPPAPSTAQ
jgi:hypothetical protein